MVNPAVRADSGNFTATRPPKQERRFFMDFKEECIKLDRHIKKTGGPKARLNWQPLYYKALKYVTPIDLRQMSISDVFELVGVREKASGQAAPGAGGNHKWTEDDEEEARDNYNRVIELAKNTTIKIACERVAISRQTFYNYKKKFG